ncbi:MAG: hypothetical protein K8J31_15450 [Anaerolineae bacterium]|nr:hypothetical protein [Anaerolineae bacterium]
MGGYYSGRWFGYTRKTTAEECHKISIADFNKGFLNRRYHESGVVYESETDGAKYARVLAKCAVDRLLNRSGDDIPDRPKQTGQQFRLTRTACNYGGWRYWLICPRCFRRCGKVYKPGYGGSYACRKCHDLSYISAQEAHKCDRSKTIGPLVWKLDRLTRAEMVQRKMFKARIGSKNWWRLNRRYERIMCGVRLGT